MLTCTRPASRTMLLQLHAFMHDHAWTPADQSSHAGTHINLHKYALIYSYSLQYSWTTVQPALLHSQLVASRFREASWLGEALAAPSKCSVDTGQSSTHVFWLSTKARGRKLCLQSQAVQCWRTSCLQKKWQKCQICQSCRQKCTEKGTQGQQSLKILLWFQCFAIKSIHC